MRRFGRAICCGLNMEVSFGLVPTREHIKRFTAIILAVHGGLGVRELEFLILPDQMLAHSPCRSDDDGRCWGGQVGHSLDRTLPNSHLRGSIAFVWFGNGRTLN